jgi:hypothetical protein
LEHEVEGMTFRVTDGLVVGVLVLCATGQLIAKGDTKRLVVTGGPLKTALEITSPDALADVWGGSFLGEPTTEPSATLPRYTVSFYVVPPRETADRLMYVVTYVRDPDGTGGVVCLPGRGEPMYALNVTTILRATQDGRCHRGEARWSLAINAALR